MQRIKRASLLLIMLALVLAIGCSKESPMAPVSNRGSAVATSIKLSDENYAASALDSLIMQVTGEGLDPIRRKLSIDGTKARMQLEVPAKKMLKMKVTGYQDTTAVLQGSQDFTAQSGQITNVQIKLDFLVPTIILSPPDSVIQKGDSVDVYLAARSVANMSTFGAEVHFDPTKLQVVSLSRQDDFLKKNHGSVMQVAFTQDNTLGVVKAVLGIFPASAAVSGSGFVGKITFKAIETDTTDIWIKIDNKQDSDLGLFDKSADLMYSVGLGSRLFIQQAPVE